MKFTVVAFIFFLSACNHDHSGPILEDWNNGDASVRGELIDELQTLLEEYPTKNELISILGNPDFVGSDFIEYEYCERGWHLFLGCKRTLHIDFEYETLKKYYSYD